MEILHEYLNSLDVTMDRKCVPLVILVAKELETQMNRTTAKYGLTYLQNSVLHFLEASESGTMTVSELDSYLQQSTNTSRSVNQLLKKGLVTKKRDEDDDRVVNVTITQEGRDLHNSAEGDMYPLYTLGLNEEDATILYKIMSKVMTFQESQKV